MNIILSISKKEINAGISSDKIMEYASLGVNGYRINLSKVIIYIKLKKSFH